MDKQNIHTYAAKEYAYIYIYLIICLFIFHMLLPASFSHMCKT